MVGRPEDEADPLVAKRRQMAVGLLHRDGVVRRDARKVQVLGGGVDEDDRQAQLEQPQVVVVRRVGLGVLAAGEHHARHLPLEEHLDVLGLGHAPRPRAEDRVEPALGERAADHLRESREDRVLQLGHDEPDHARTSHPQVRRPLVADHVERGEHGGAGRIGDPRLPVQDATDRRLADAGLLRYVCKIPRHSAIIRRIRASPARSRLNGRQSGFC